MSTPSMPPLSARSTPRLSSAIATHTSPAVGSGFYRNEKTQFYRTVAEQEPWGVRTKQDVAAYAEEQRAKTARDRAKRETFRLQLDAQLKSNAKKREQEKRQKELDAQREQDLYLSYKKKTELEKKQKREAHKREIAEIDRITMENVGLKEKLIQEEIDAAKNMRAMDEKLWLEAKAAEASRREKQRRIQAEMWECNQASKRIKEEEIRRESELDKKLFEQEIQRRARDEQRRKDQVARRHEVVNSNVEAWESVRRGQEDRQKRLEQKVEKERLADLQVQEAAHQARLEKAKRVERESKEFIAKQIEDRKQRKEAQRAEQLRERQVLDEDTANYYSSCAAAKSRRRQRNIMYGQELASQAQDQQHRVLDDILTPHRPRH